MFELDVSVVNNEFKKVVDKYYLSIHTIAFNILINSKIDNKKIASQYKSL